MAVFAVFAVVCFHYARVMFSFHATVATTSNLTDPHARMCCCCLVGFHVATDTVAPPQHF